MKTVTVKFTDRYGSSSNTYDYLVEDDTDVSAGDFAVAHNGTEYAIVKVISVAAGITARARKTLVSIITKDTVESYNKFNESIVEYKKLYERLDQLVAQEYENNKYRVLAASNSEAASILAKLGIK